MGQRRYFTPESGLNEYSCRAAITSSQSIDHPSSTVRTLAASWSSVNGFADEIDALIEHAAVHDGIGRIAGGEHHLEIGPPAQRLVGEFPTVDVRHHHVGEQAA